MSASWSTERVALLKVLKAQGQTASRMAQVLNALEGPHLTRNSVIAKCDRLGLCSPGGGALYRQHAAATARIARVRTEKAKPKRPAYVAPTRGPILPTENSIPFSERTRFQCAMFCDGEEGSMGLVCGEPVARGSWCVRCAARAYQPPQIKQGKAA